MGFNGTDIEKMFAEAASAAEDTGEKDVGGPATVKTEVKQPAETPKVEPAQTTPTPTKQSAQTAAPVKQEPVKQEPVKQEPIESKPLVSEKSSGILNSSKGITEDSIGRILDMNETFAKFDDTQKDFVSGYFQLEEGERNVSKVIYRALIASQRDLDALDKIVKAKGFDPAGRAFYLMGLDNSIIQDIYEQVEILTGELGEAGTVNDRNKLNVCRKVEGVISEMPKDVFTYIEKLQQFTNKAVQK